MQSNLTTNDSQYAAKQGGRPCFYAGFSPNVQFQFLYYSNFVLTPITILLGLWCFLSNGLVLIAVLKGSLRIRTGLLYLCSLTLTDVLWGGVVTPLYIRFRIVEMITGKACMNRSDWDSPVMVISFFLCLFAMLGTLGVMSVDRYLVVTKPLWYKVNMKKRYAISACSAVWLMSTLLVVLKQVNLFPLKAVESFEAGYVICSSVMVIVIQLLTLVALRKHNNSVAQTMEESARVNPVSASNAAERQLAVTTRHVVSLLGICLIPIAFLVGLSNLIQLKVNIFTEPLYFPVATLCSGINPVLYYKGNLHIREGITKIVKCNIFKCFDSQADREFES